MSQLGYMVVSIGLSSYTLALFHLVNHAFFKASLFMAAGAIIHAFNDNQSLLKYGGLSKLLPYISQVILISSLALLAYPFTSGYYSKELIIAMSRNTYNPFYSNFLKPMVPVKNSSDMDIIPEINSQFLSDQGDSLLLNTLNHPIYWIITITALITCLYSYKLIYYTFISQANGPYSYYENIHYSTNYINIPLFILTIMSIFSGYLLSDIIIGMGNNIFSDSIFTHPVHSKLIETEFNTITLFKLLPLILSIIGILIYTYLLENNYFLVKNNYFNITNIKYMITKSYTKIFIFFNQKFFYELFINIFVIQKVLDLSYTLNKTLDRGFIELWGPYGISLSLSKVSFYVSKLDSGIVTSYSLYMFLSLQIYCIIIYTLIMFLQS